MYFDHPRVSPRPACSIVHGVARLMAACATSRPPAQQQRGTQKTPFPLSRSSENVAMCSSRPLSITV